MTARQVALDNVRMNIGRAILEVRKEKGLKQETIALDAGTTLAIYRALSKAVDSPRYTCWNDWPWL